MKYLLILCVFLMIGCSSAPKQPKYKYEAKVDDAELDVFMQGKPEAYRPYLNVYMRQGARNSVLNEMRIGLLAFNNGEYELASWLFDRAILKIETVYAKTKSAKKARSKFSSEEVKDYKGDAYERAMVYFYRGLIYLQNDDYENARASMLGGLLQDSLAEDQEYEQDFASLFYLAGWASQCNGNDSQAEDYFNQAQKLKPSLIKPLSENNTLLVATSGNSPVKKRQGKYNEQRYFESNTDASYRRVYPILDVRNNEIAYYLSENLQWQATTRGGRSVDIINEGKAVFKENTDKTGNALIQSGNALMTQANYSNNRNLGNAGAAFALFGLVSKGISRFSKATADIRYWDNLPRMIYLSTTAKNQLDLGPIEFKFMDNVTKQSKDKSTDFNQQALQNLEMDDSCDLIFMTDTSPYLPYRHINP